MFSAKTEGFSTCVIDSNDNDMLILLVYFKNLLPSEILLVIRVAVRKIVLNESLTKTLPAFHILTGCDTISQFTGMGKKPIGKHSSTIPKIYLDSDQSTFPNNIKKFVINSYFSTFTIQSRLLHLEIQP
ncbi:unnamed protein product [Psylliodes chrysocephalus]|uniref:Uncharacterized protein n=1 Tax=Psylliodes chrysocephalus TaxID=3402493 RepID=A0A9P0D870_9CUCU|nr:unnamed protein product [Psylliodes chrysocephala]